MGGSGYPGLAGVGITGLGGFGGGGSGGTAARAINGILDGSGVGGGGGGGGYSGGGGGAFAGGTSNPLGGAGGGGGSFLAVDVLVNSDLVQIADISSVDGSVVITAVPEPASFALFSAGLAGLLALRRRS